MNYTLVARIVAVLLLVVSSFMLLPILVAVYYREYDIIPSFFAAMLSTATLAITVFAVTERPDRQLGTRDGFLMVTLSWLGAAAVGAAPFYLSGSIPRYTDAFFETMSGFSTTGATILTEIEALPYAVLFWRSLTHWLGGMGIIVLTVAIFPILGVGGLQLIKAEVPGPTVDKITPKITETAKTLWLIYLALTVAQTLLLMLGGLNLFEGLTHTFGTLATGGFHVKDASVGHYGSRYINVVTTVFMLMAGVNFILYFKTVTGRARAVTGDSELKAYLSIFLVVALAISIALRLQGTYEDFLTSLEHGAFQVASILTTTGYVTADFELWPSQAQTLLLMMMFFGGCSGSTGGGVKIVRILTLVKLGLSEMKYLLHPRGVFSVRLSGLPVRKNAIYALAGFLVLYLMSLLVTTVVVGSSGVDLMSAFSTALATLGNIGPGFGMIGATENYAHYPDYVKWFLSVVMMMGRLEIFTVLILFTPRFWKP